MTFLFCPQLLWASTIIYYDDVESPDGLILSNMLYNLCRHFDTNVETVNVSSYYQGEMEKYDFVFYIGTEDHNLPDSFLGDISSGENKVFWIGSNIEYVDDHVNMTKRFGFEIPDWDEGEGYTQIEYKNNILSRNEEDLSFYEVQTTDNATVHAYFSNPDNLSEKVPQCIEGNDLFFLNENPFYTQFSDDRIIVFADMLHEFYKSGISNKKRIMLRIEDIAPGMTDPELLKDLGQKLEDLDVPFSFGVIPIFKDPEGIYHEPGTQIFFSDAPELVYSINYLLQHGGTMLMHGVTHQHDQGISRVDWEFSYGLDNVPLDCDSEDWVRAKIEYGIAQFESIGCMPKIWETPHYSASHGDYKVISEYFDYYYERPLIFPLSPDADPVFKEYLNPEMQRVPFFLPETVMGMGLFPENLGNPEPGEGIYLEDVLKGVEKLSIVRDAIPSFFIHPELVTFDELTQAILELQDKGYTFVSPKQLVDGIDEGECSPYQDDDDDDDNDDDDDDEETACG